MRLGDGDAGVPEDPRQLADVAAGLELPRAAGIGSLWNIADLSAYLQIPVSSIYKMTARQAAVRIPHIRIGGTLRLCFHHSLLGVSNSGREFWIQART